MTHFHHHLTKGLDYTGFTQTNLVELDPVFRQLLTFRPALQLTYDCFGPMFHLTQDKVGGWGPMPGRASRTVQNVAAEFWL